MSMPVRLRLSRQRGFNLQAASRAINGMPAVSVARPGPWGNPFNFRPSACCWLALSYGCRGDAAGRQRASVFAFCDWIAPEAPTGQVVAMDRQVVVVTLGKRQKVPIGPKVGAGVAPSTAAIVEQLAGRNLACWCRLGEPCHADVLLAIAAGRPARAAIGIAA